MSKTVEQILSEYLKKHGYDGLCRDECGCDLDHLAPCMDYCLDCRPGYKVKAPKGSGVDYYIVEDKNDRWWEQGKGREHS